MEVYKAAVDRAIQICEQVSEFYHTGSESSPRSAATSRIDEDQIKGSPKRDCLNAGRCMTSSARMTSLSLNDTKPLRRHGTPPQSSIYLQSRKKMKSDPPGETVKPSPPYHSTNDPVKTALAYNTGVSHFHQVLHKYEQNSTGRPVKKERFRACGFPWKTDRIFTGLGGRKKTGIQRV